MSTGAIAAIIAVLIVTIAIPLVTMLFLHRRGGSWFTFLTGAGIFIVFALLLEPVLHRLVLKSAAGTVIQGNIWLYGIYGGLAAGIFEETGRFLAFKVILKKRINRVTSLTYGIGHGGAEAFLLTGLTMVSNLAVLLLYSRGEALPAEIAPAMEILLNTPAAAFLWGGFERLTAMTLHMALSVLVFASVRTEQHWLFPAAILAHAAVDFAAVTANAYLPLAATEGLILFATLLIAVWAAHIYKNLPQNTENP